jgi:tRNA modification GTPase
MEPDVSTVVVELTPTGRAAVAIVLVAGPDATRAVDQCCSLVSGHQIGEAPLNRILLGRWDGPAGEELIVCRRSSDSVEIHCHGGIAAVSAIVARLHEFGCQPITWQNWLARSSHDPIHVAAQIALANAPTARTAAILLDQFDGALTTAIGQVLDAVTAGDYETAYNTLNAMLAHRSIGLHLTAPWQVVIAGRPNVGKSSLMNALVGYQRAIVCDLPGTTRDVVGAATAIGGWPIQFSDTAGLRNAGDQLEQAGIERAASAIAGADLVILIDDVKSSADCSEPHCAWSAADITSHLSPSTPQLHVLNKIDLLPPGVSPPAANDDVHTSALSGQGIETLIAAISRALVPSPPVPGAAVPFTADQIERLEIARNAARRGDRAAIDASLRPLISPN